jgi:hypothetical protein
MKDQGAFVKALMWRKSKIRARLKGSGTQLFVGAVVAISLFMLACSDAKRFQDQAVRFSNDNRIDETEFNKLTDLAKQSTDGSLKGLFDPVGNVDGTKLHSYLLKLFAAKNPNISASDIWQTAPQEFVGFNVDTYIENSASMDGYVKGVTEFETAIYNFIGDLKVSGLAKTLNLNYVNKNVTYTKSNALQADIQDFIEKLEPSSFAQRGGDRSSSDLQSIIKMMLAKLDGDNVVILVSDFVFSPGKNQDAKDYLNNQTVGLKIAFAEKLRSFDLALAVVQLQSSFDGAYYDKFNRPRSLKCERPYYIWIFGKTNQIKEILDRKLVDSVKGGILNRFTFVPARDPIPAEQRVLVRPRTGSFDLPSGVKGPITNARADHGAFEFSMLVNFPGSLQSPNFFLDSSNYVVSNPAYTLTVQPVNGGDPSMAGFTHRLVLRTSELRDEPLEIAVIGKSPVWAESSTSVDDTGITCVSDEIHKTFGLKYLIDGVNDAFYPQGSLNEVYKVRILIKR